jgi:hypothetical protein
MCNHNYSTLAQYRGQYIAWHFVTGSDDPAADPASKSPTIPMADLDSGRGGRTAAAFAVEVAMAPVEVAVAVVVAMALVLVLHRTSPGSEALMRHSARVPTD